MDEEWNRKYTAASLIEELALLERHYRDGSYTECSCVPEKHLPLIAGLASEMVMFVPSGEKAFYENLAEVARKARVSIEEGSFSYLPHNPRTHLPHSFTVSENPGISAKLSRCIRHVEAKACPHGFRSYEECEVNPVAVCRSSIGK